MFGFVSLFSPKFWCPDASWVSGSLNLYLMLLLLSREFFIFQIADVHLLHSATWWRLLGQKYLLTAEVTRLRLRGERLAVWCGNEIEPRYLGCYNFNEQWRGLRKQIPAFASRFHFFASIILSAAESSSKVGAFHRRTAPSLALAR